MTDSEKRAYYLRMGSALTELKRIGATRKCRNPRYAIAADPRERTEFIVIPYSSAVSPFGFETRKEAEEFLAQHLELYKTAYGIKG